MFISTLKLNACAVVIGIICVLSYNAYCLQITVDYQDAQGEGFLESGDRGNARRAAFEHAVSIWASQLDGSIPLVIGAEFNSFGNPDIKARTDIPAASANLSGLPEPFFWFVSSLGSQLRGVSMPSGQNDVHPNVHMFVEFNEDIDVQPDPAGHWYYGTDGLLPAGDFDFLGAALHEIGHNLGFIHRINFITGANQPVEAGFPFWYLNFVVRRGTTNLFLDEEMNDSERLAAITSGEVYFSGPAVIAAQIPNNPFSIPDPANPPVNEFGEAKLFAPAIVAPGSFVAHWDDAHNPDGRALLMKRDHSGSILNIDYTREALIDMGWTFQASPQIQVSPGSLNFANTNVNAGPTAEQTVTITNVGSVNLQITGIATEDGFGTTEADQYQLTNSTAPASLAPSQTREVRVVFDPDSVGTKFAYLRIYSNDTHKWVERITLSSFAFDGTASAAWVDFDFEGQETGVESAPFNSLAEGVEFIVAGGTVNIQPGTTSETPTINKALTLVNTGSGARGGAPDIVRIGDISARFLRNWDLGLNRTGFISMPAKNGSIESKPNIKKIWLESPQTP